MNCGEGDLESITVVGNMEDGTMKTNQNGVLKIAENEAVESVNSDKIKKHKSWQKSGYNTNWSSCADKES